VVPQMMYCQMIFPQKVTNDVSPNNVSLRVFS
jgi:hypothetical protein